MTACCIDEDVESHFGALARSGTDLTRDSKNSASRVLKYEQADADSARLILQTAGIDPASKNLFK